VSASAPPGASSATLAVLVPCCCTSPACRSSLRVGLEWD
jgi:hypothetical protein